MGMEPASHLIKGETILCPQCLKEPAKFNHLGAIVYGKKCREKLDKESQPFGPAIEMIPESMRQERYKYKKDIVQPYREGEPSLEYAEAYPEKAAKMFKGQTPKYVWKGDVEGW